MSDLLMSPARLRWSGGDFKLRAMSRELRASIHYSLLITHHSRLTIHVSRSSFRSQTLNRVRQCCLDGLKTHGDHRYQYSRNTGYQKNIPANIYPVSKIL